jgi:hypothetical protein
MSKALDEYRQSIGKTTEFYHWSNEARMINRISGLPDRNVRDEFTEEQLHPLTDLTVLNTKLIKKGLPFGVRRDKLETYMALIGD